MENKNERVFRFEQPKQVKFLNMDAPDEVNWIGGIAFGADIICGCCGGIFEIAELYSDWDDFGKQNAVYKGIESPIVVYDDWMDINAEIRGDA